MQLVDHFMQLVISKPHSFACCSHLDSLSPIMANSAENDQLNARQIRCTLFLLASNAPLKPDKLHQLRSTVFLIFLRSIVTQCSW